jgi:hypothetical protein
LKYLRRGDRKIRKRPGQIVKAELDAPSAERLARGGRNIYPVLRLQPAGRAQALSY